MEARHTGKNINVSLRKVRTFIPMLRNMSPSVALMKLSHMPHSGARALHAAIKTAVSNAQFSLKVPEDMLEFRKVYADQGMKLKRFRAGSRGTAAPIVRQMTHITVIVGVKQLSSSAPKDDVSLVKSEEVQSEVKEDKKAVVKKPSRSEKKPAKKPAVKKAKTVKKVAKKS